MRRPLPIALLLTACSFDSGGGNGTGDSSSGEGSTTGATTIATTIATTVAETSTAADSSTAMPETSTGEPGTSSETGAPVDLEHGFIRIELRRAASEGTDPFVGTTRIQIIMTYEQCLFDFYAAHPEYTPNGTMGAEIWGPYDAGGEGWLDRLCEVPVDNLVECSVSTFEQQLENIPGLRINYMVGDMLEDKVVAFGPMPTAELAGCDMPTMRLQNGGSVGGYDDTGAKIWEGYTFAPNSAATDSETPIVVDVVAN